MRKRWMKTAVTCFAALIILACTVMAASTLIWPEEGKKHANSGGLVIDYSHAENGYIMIKGPKSSKKQKVRVQKGNEYYNYDVPGDGSYAIFPLQMGNGSYRATLYAQVSGNKYTQKAQVNFSAKLSDENACFLCPSTYVWYTPDSPAVKKSMELCEGLETDGEKVKAIISFMTDYFVFDHIRAVSQKTAYYGDIEGVWKSRKGLCQDLAVIFAAMCRVQGIPTQMCTGTVTAKNGTTMQHAWNYVYIDGKYQRVDMTARITKAENKKYTPEKYY